MFCRRPHRRARAIVCSIRPFSLLFPSIIADTAATSTSIRFQKTPLPEAGYLAKLPESMFKPRLIRRIPEILFLCLSLRLSQPATVAANGNQEQSLTFCCAATNDLFSALSRAGEHYQRFSHPAEAIDSAPAESALLILADEY